MLISSFTGDPSVLCVTQVSVWCVTLGVKCINGKTNILRSNFKRTYALLKKGKIVKKKKEAKKFKRIIKARNKTCAVSLPLFRTRFVANGRFNAVLATFFVKRAVSPPINCIIGKIMKKIKKKLKRKIKARNISYEVSFPFFRSFFVVHGPFNAVLAAFIAKRVVLPAYPH